MYTPITVFEAWLGQSIAEYLASEFDEKINELDSAFKYLSVDVEQRDEDGYYNKESVDVSDDKEVKNLQSMADDIFGSMINQLCSMYQKQVDTAETYENVFKELFQFGKKYRIGMQLCKYHDTQQNLNENHFQMAKNDKANFETLILNFNK